jgi:hypothetical protein
VEDVEETKKELAMGDDETKRLSDRANLRYLLAAHPAWKNTQLAQATHRSIAWVKKWKKRFAALSPPDRAAPLALAPHRPPRPQPEPKRPDSRLVERIVIKNEIMVHRQSM